MHYSLIFKATENVDYSSDWSNIAEEFVPQTSTFGGSLDQASNIPHLLRLFKSTIWAGVVFYG